jgi:ABC-type transport system involved in multi-copper enzyme maturation permease subunit
MAIVLAVGSVSKSSMLAALLGIGIWLGLNIVAGILSVFSNQASVLTFLPGSGASGILKVSGPSNQTSVSTGTDSIGSLLTSYILNPLADVTFFRMEIDPVRMTINRIPMYTEPLSLVVARSIAVTGAYILVFNFIAWYALKRAQIVE